MAKNLYVGNLSYNTTEASLASFFETVGKVSSVNIIVDRETGRSKGFAFVQMAEDAEAAQAISQLDGQMLDGRPIRVQEARPKPPRSDRGGRGRG